MRLRLYFHQGTDLFIKLLLQVLIGTTYLLTPPDKVGPFDHFMHKLTKRFSEDVDIYFIIQIFNEKDSVKLFQIYRIVKLKTCFILCKSSGDLLKMNKKSVTFFISKLVQLCFFICLIKQVKVGKVTLATSVWFFHHSAFSYDSSNGLHERMHSYAACIYLTFIHCVF